MRLWHYELVPYLPKAMLVSQWRECIAIKRQWEKGTLKHRLVSYVMDHNKKYFRNYVINLVDELNKRNITINKKLYSELIYFSANEYGIVSYNLYYTEHNDQYLKQCLYNLQEKADRGIVTPQEWQLIYDNFAGYLD